MAKAKSAVEADRIPMHQLKIELIGTEPSIWRRLLVRGDMNLGLLHAVIQAAMGWTNSHLHQFTIGNVRYSDPRMDQDMEPDQTPDRDEGKTALIEAVPQEKAELVYEYDFGDSWEHLITVEKIHAPDAAPKGFAKCLDGSRACPPDDCGGVDGYANLLEIIKDPKHEEYESMMEWLGGRFDPEAFDIKKVNKYLAMLKWPRTTDSQLAGVLMKRDGVS